jgi:hypothetical protein
MFPNALPGRFLPDQLFTGVDQRDCCRPFPYSTGKHESFEGIFNSALTIRTNRVLKGPTIPSLYSIPVSFLTRAVILVVFVLCAVPGSLILADSPAATAAPTLAQGPPPGPQLSAEEQEALDAKKAGTLKDEQKRH